MLRAFAFATIAPADPVISYDRLIRNSDVDLYVSHQVVKIGEMQAKYALDNKPKGNYILIGGSPSR